MIFKQANILGFLFVTLFLFATTTNANNSSVSIPYAPKFIYKNGGINYEYEKQDYIEMTKSSPAALGVSQPDAQKLEDKLLSGLFEFALSRAEAEALLLIQERMDKDLCKNEKSKRLFSHICYTLESNMIGVGTGFGLELQYAAKQDIDNILVSTLLEKQVEKSKITKIKNVFSPSKKIQYTAQYTYLILVAATLREFNNGRTPLSIIRGLSLVSDDFCNQDTECKDAVREIKKAAYKIRIIESTLSNIKNSSFQCNQENCGRILKASVSYLKEKSISDKRILNEIETNLKTSWGIINKIARSLDVITNEISSAKKAISQASSDLSYDQNQIFMARFLSMESMIEILSITIKENEKIITAYNNISQLKLAIVKQNYTDIIFSTIAIIDEQELTFNSNPNDNDRIKRQFVFIGALLNAKDSAEVSQILRSAALPVGSYRMKKDRGMNTIAFFPGLKFSAARTEYTVTDSSFDPTTNPFGVTLPIGFHFSNPSIGGAYISILDFSTAFTSTKNQEDIQQEAEINWNKVYSPGIYYTFTRRSWGPVTLGMGISVTPNAIENNDGSRDNLYQTSFIMVWDVSLFSF